MTLGNLSTSRPWDDLLEQLRGELRKWPGVDYILPYQGDSVRQKFVSLTLKINGQEKTITCERFSGQHHGQEANLLALTQVVKATRMADQRGIGSLLAEVSSMVALQEYDPWRVLGATQGDYDAARKAYQDKIKLYHPDVAGTGNRVMYDYIKKAADDIGVSA